MLNLRKTIVALLALPLLAHAQTTQPLNLGGGVGISPEGVLTARATSPSPIRPSRENQQFLGYVSLPRLLEAAKNHLSKNEPLPADIAAVGGITQLRYLFIYPESHDIVLAGAAESVNSANPLMPVGKRSGRPTLQLDDLILALRLTAARGPRETFGCSIDMRPGALDAAKDVMARDANASNAKLSSDLKQALGPQTIRLFGLPADSRMALRVVSADYRMKRMAMGAETMPISGVGNGLGAGYAANRVWFTPAYEPLLASAAGDAFELRGPRLKLDAGAKLFESQGASDEARQFAKKFSEKIPQLAAAVDAFADLQNITDLLVVAALIHQEKLDQKAGVDLAWALDPAGYPLEHVTVPATADTNVHFATGSVVAGGVMISPRSVINQENRAADEKQSLAAARKRPENNWLLLEPPASPVP